MQRTKSRQMALALAILTVTTIFSADRAAAGPVLTPVLICTGAKSKPIDCPPYAYCIPNPYPICRTVMMLCGFRDPNAPKCIPLKRFQGWDAQKRFHR